MTFWISGAAAVASLVLALPLHATEFGNLERPDRSDVELMEQYRKALYQRHQECSSEAITRLLSQVESVTCGSALLLLKLSFLDGVSHERYLRMPPKTKAVANRKGYDAYLAWQHRLFACAASLGHQDDRTKPGPINQRRPRAGPTTS